MPTARQIVRKAAVRPDQVVDTVTLDHAARAQGHAHFHTAGGLCIDLALERASGLEDGDALRLEDGRLVGVRAAEEALLEVRAGSPAGSCASPGSSAAATSRPRSAPRCSTCRRARRSWCAAPAAPPSRCRGPSAPRRPPTTTAPAATIIRTIMDTTTGTITPKSMIMGTITHMTTGMPMVTRIPMITPHHDHSHDHDHAHGHDHDHDRHGHRH